MSIIIVTYVLYLTISVLLTVWVGRTLRKNGRIFLVDAFSGNEPLADSVNRRTQLKHVPPPVPPMGRMMPMQG